MCEASICKCHCAMPKVEIRLELGKFYQTFGGFIVKIVGHDNDMYVGRKLDQNGGLLDYQVNGHRYVKSAASHVTLVTPPTWIVREYKEPRITKRDVVLYGPTEKNKAYGPEYRHVWSGEVGGHLDRGNSEYWREISRQTVTFKEEA